MEDHQKYFPIRDADGRLMARFVAVANLESRDPAQVIAGNERVIRPRLADAAFFWDQDRQTRLADRVPALNEVIFQETLGTLYDKSSRVARLARRLAEAVGAEGDAAERSGWLSKADLLTQMVDEFPELQGTMATYYALEDGEDPRIAQALKEAYQPRFGGDVIPASGCGAMVAIADRLDTLMGLFGIGQPPTGSKDPFALRRAGLGILRIAIEGGWPLDIRLGLEEAAAALHDQGITLADDSVQQVEDFLMERLRAYYRDQGFSPDSFDAVLGHRPTQPLDFDRRLRAVEAFRSRPEAAALAEADKRIRNIRRKSEVEGSEGVAEQGLTVDAEIALWRAIQEAESALRPAVETGDYGSALNTLAGLRDPVDRFFEDVMVMADDPTQRRHRLALLTQLAGLFHEVADLAELQD
jgi:glycyl-tRNA synthetase beta chain